MSLLRYIFRNRDELLCTLSAWIFSKLPNQLTLLKRLEVGVFFFCWRQARLAEAEGKETLATILREQAESEYHHAQIFCSLTGNKMGWTVDDLFKREFKCSFNWGNVRDSEESFSADGLSMRYLSARIFFNGIYAKDYSWEDKLAFMSVLESFQACFYRKLIRFISPSLAKTLRIICAAEEDHSIAIRLALAEMVGTFQVAPLMFKWKRRLYFAIALLPLDLVEIYIRSKFSNFLSKI